MATIRHYRDLLVWQRGHTLALAVYDCSRNFPKIEQFGLTNQIQRAVVSIPSNIVEGFERGSQKEFRQFLTIARGSTGEVRVQLELAKDLGYMTEQEFQHLFDLTTEVHKMLNALIKTTSK